MKNALFIAMLLLSSAGHALAYGHFYLSGALGFTNQPFWAPTLFETAFYQDGACVGVINSTTQSLAGVVTLTNTLPAGNYSVWMRATAGGGYTPTAGSGIITVTAGDSSNTLVILNSTLSAHLWNKFTLSPSASFSQVTLDCSNSFYTVSAIVYSIECVYITSNTSEAPLNYGSLANTVDLFLDWTQPTITNSADIVLGNLIPNSSFEFGNGYWINSRTSNRTNTIYPQWQREALDATTSAHGNQCIVLGTNHGETSLLSPMIRLRGSNCFRPYTLSFYAKGSGVPITSEFGHITSNKTGYASGLLVTNAWGAITNGWARYSTNFYFAPAPSSEMYLIFYNGNITGTNYVMIDGVMLEEGTNLNAYAGRDIVDFGLLAERVGAVFDVSETPTIKLLTYNYTGGALSRTYNYEVFNWLNERTMTGSASVSCSSGLSTNTISITSASNGTSRIVAWLAETPTMRDELTFSKVFLPSSTALNNAQIIGVHANPSTSAADTNRLWGFGKTRTLSPGNVFRWHDVEVTSNVFTWFGTDFMVNQISNRQIMLGSIGGGFLSHTLTNNYPQLNRWSNWVWTVVNRYKSVITNWEDFNEPTGYGSVGFTSTQYAPMLEQTALAVKAADPTARLWAFGGIGTIPSTPSSDYYVTNAWGMLSSVATQFIYGISIHLYPAATTLSYMEKETDARMHFFSDWAYANGKKVSMTESGVFTTGHEKTDAAGVVFAGETVSPYARQGYHVFERNLPDTELICRNLLRCLGFGYSEYYYYDSRNANQGFARWDSQPSIFGYNDNLRGWGAMLIHAQSLIGLSVGVGTVTNTTSTNMEAFVFSNGLGTNVLAVWNMERGTNRTLTVTNGSFEVRDMMGNRLQTNSTSVLVVRHPRYWVSGTLSTGQLAQTFRFASVANTADIVAPNPSIDLSTHGTITTNTFPLRFRWTAQDANYMNTDLYPSNVLTRYKVNGHEAWSDWSPLRAASYSSLPSGTYNLAIEAKDIEGTTSSMDGPQFIMGSGFEPAGSSQKSGITGKVTISGKVDLP